MHDLPPLQGGTLYLVATPIGNLEDITARALRVLRECDVIAAEDTRHTGLLLQAHGIKKPLISYFKFNEARRSEEILTRLRASEKVALVTDAGTPGISDPGQRVVAAAVAAGIRVEAVPGPCALVAALTASGMPTDEFHFTGFLPQKSSQRLRELERLKYIPGTIVLYESPYRVEKLLGELAEVMPARTIVLAREITKKFEQFLRGRPKELAEYYEQRKPKGEFVVLIEPEAAPPKAAAAVPTEFPVSTVGGLIFREDGQVLLMRTHKWSDLWGIPGGKIKFGETSEAALRRELKEETNLDIDEIEFVMVQDCIHSSEFYRDAHFLLLNFRCLAKPPLDVQLNDEAEAFQWIAPEDALSLPLNAPTRTLIEQVLRR